MGWETYLALIITFLLALVAGVSLGVAFWSLTWPSVKGLIEVSFVNEEPAASADLIDEALSGKDETHQLAYSYTVDGTKFLGANLKPCGGGSNGWALRNYGLNGLGSGNVVWSGARDAASWYHEGAIIDVYYCPRRPQWSCLERGGFLLPIVLSGFAAFAYFGFVR